METYDWEKLTTDLTEAITFIKAHSYRPPWPLDKAVSMGNWSMTITEFASLVTEVMATAAPRG